MKIKKPIIIAAIVILLVLASAITIITTKNDGLGKKILGFFGGNETTGAIAAKTGDITIYKSDLDLCCALNPDKTRDELLKMFIIQELMQKKIKEAGITVSKGEIDKTVEDTKALISRGLEEGDNSICEMLLSRCQNAGITWEEYFDLDIFRINLECIIGSERFFDRLLADENPELSAKERQDYIEAYKENLYKEIENQIKYYGQ